MRLFVNKRHLSKLFILFFIVAIFLMREISIYWINISGGFANDFDRKLFYNSHKINHELQNILSSVWSVSEEQLLIDPKTIITTLKFMIEETDETDPELVEFVRSLIIPPVRPGSAKKLTLLNPKKYNSSQTETSTFIDKLLDEKKNGFFIEAGANDGEDISNSLFFELQRGWTGILIEPVPSFFKIVEAKNRNAYMLNACIAQGKPMISKFRIHQSLTGRLKEMNVKHQKRIDFESGTNFVKLGYFPCFSLKTIMKAIGVSHVDYFSLDIEGGELDVLKSINFNELDITTLSIEHNGFEETKQEITSLMESNGYRTEKVDGQDGYYRKTSKLLSNFF